MNPIDIFNKRNFRINSDSSNTINSKISGLADSTFFKEIKGLSFRNLGSSTYLVPTKEDTLTQRILKIAGWIFGIIPSTILILYLYERIMDSYHRIQGYPRLEEASDKEVESQTPNHPTMHQEISKELPAEILNDTFETTIAQENPENKSSDALEILGNPSAPHTYVLRTNHSLDREKIMLKMQKDTASDIIEEIEQSGFTNNSDEFAIIESPSNDIKSDDDSEEVEAPSVDDIENDDSTVNATESRNQFAPKLNPDSSSTSIKKDDFEYIDVPDAANIPVPSAPTTSKNHSAPIFFSPNNPFHLEKYTYSLRIIKEVLVECESDTDLHRLLSIVNQDNLNSRDKYREYIDALRKLLEDTTLNSDTKANLEKLCFSAFTTNVTTEFIDRFLPEATNNKLKSSSELSMYTIADAITTTNNELKHSPSKKSVASLNFQKFAGEMGYNFDPTKYSNIPEIRSIHTVKSLTKKDPYKVIYMRHGTPTIETGIVRPAQSTDNLFSRAIRHVSSIALGAYTPKTTPEYKAFLNRARHLNRPVFYVNHQKIINDTSAEYGRSLAIQKHETTHPEHFFFMTLPLDGVTLDSIQDTDQWKTELIDNLIQEKNGFRLPNRLKNDFSNNKGMLEEQFKKLLDKLHKLYFASNPLTHVDQHALLLIFYSYLKDFIKDKYQIQIMVSACKDNKDRGNATSSVDEALYNLRLGRENDSQALYDLYIRVLAPFIIKYEHIVDKRLEFLTNVLQHISTLTESQKQAIREFHPNGFEILDQKVPR